MAALLGIALLWKFTTVCAVSLPGPAPIPRFAARPATSGASQRLTTRLCQQKSAPILPSRPLAPCLVLCSAESGIGLWLATRPPRCGCSPSNSKDANKSALLNCLRPSSLTDCNRNAVALPQATNQSHFPPNRAPGTERADAKEGSARISAGKAASLAAGSPQWWQVWPRNVV